MVKLVPALHKFLAFIVQVFRGVLRLGRGSCIRTLKDFQQRVELSIQSVQTEFTGTAAAARTSPADRSFQSRRFLIQRSKCLSQRAFFRSFLELLHLRPEFAD